MTYKTRGFAPLMTVLVAVFVVLAAFGAQARTTVTAMRLGIHPDGITRFVMDLSDRMEFHLSSHADPMRIVINTDGAAWAADPGPAKIIGSVARIKADDQGHIALMLNDPATVKSAFVIPPRDGLGWRFVMDVKAVPKAVFMAQVSPAATPKIAAAPAAIKPVPRPDPVAASVVNEPITRPEPVVAVERAPVPSQPIVVLSPAAEANQVRLSPPAPAEMKPAKGGQILSGAMPPPVERPAAAPVPVAAPAPVDVPLAVTPVAVTKVSASLPVPDPEPRNLSRNEGRPVIVLDPGHGGVDPGAIGVSGMYEKFITLSVARELKEQLERSGRYKVHLTRDRDIFIRLRDRVSIARQYNADLFISLHADAVQNPQIKGLSVYTLSQNASDTEAQTLAEKENKADLIAGIDLSHESIDVANILIDLAQRETLNRSAGFAGGLVDEMGRETSLLSNTHRFAGFAVLKAPDVPAVLIELGYLSNELEERNLRTPVYREKLAKAISRAIDGFFLQGQKAKRP